MLLRIGIQVTVATKRPRRKVWFMANPSSNGWHAVQRHARLELLQLKLPGGQLERKAARDERLRANLTPTSMLAGRVLYGIYCLFARVLRIARRIVYSSSYLVNLAFGFKFIVARHVPGNFLSFARDIICCTFNVFFVHVTPLQC
jgi:hypothetical protein